MYSYKITNANSALNELLFTLFKPHTCKEVISSNQVIWTRAKIPLRATKIMNKSQRFS